jgi:hypothetical protein
MAEVIVGNMGVQFVTSPPTGGCNANHSPIVVLQPDGTIYTCQNGTFAPVGAGEGIANAGFNYMDEAGKYSALVVMRQGATSQDAPEPQGLSSKEIQKPSTKKRSGK